MSIKTILTTFLFRRALSERWVSLNYVLRQGEPGYEIDTGLFKIGDGSSSWADLPYPFETDVNVPRVVLVQTGLESRPLAAVVFWIGGAERPSAMVETDVWFSEVSQPDLDESPPTSPTGLESSDHTNSSFTLSWDASVDNVGVTAYRVTIDGVVYSTLSGTSQIITGRSPATEYSVTVAARDSAGNWSPESPALLVTTLADELSLLSIFGSSPPGSGHTTFADGEGSLVVGNRFYATRTLTVYGVRFFNAPDASLEFLSEDVTFQLFVQDWADGSLSTSVLGSLAPVQTKTITDVRVANEWTDALFDEPVTIAPVSQNLDGFDCVIAAYRFASGDRYQLATLGTPDALASSVDPAVFLSESGFPRAASNISVGTASYYCVDILFSEV